MRSTPLILAVLTLTAALPLAMAQAPAPVEATGPDSEGAWSLYYDITRSVAGRASLSLDVARTDQGVTTSGARSLAAADLPAGTTRLNLSFLPAEGPGDYAVSLVADGEASAPLFFHAEGASGSAARLTFQVADEPTYLNITSDSVNADGKLKNPGDDVITRATLHDGNGLGDFDSALRWTVDAAGYHDEGALDLPATPSATDVTIEQRWHASPLANATYRLSLSATRGGVAIASASRTFVIKEIPATFVPMSLANVTPDVDVNVPMEITLADRNGAPAPGFLELRMYRGSSRTNDAVATFATGETVTDTSTGLARASADGAGLTAYPATLRIPAGTSPGAMRISVVLNNATLGSATFNVTSLPTLASVNATMAGQTLVLNASGSGDGILRVELRDGANATLTETPFVGGAASVRLSAIGQRMTWNASLLARSGGPVLASREGVLAHAVPNVTLRLVSGLPRLPATFAVNAVGWDLANASVSAVFTRWDGAGEPNLTARFEGSLLTVEGPATLMAGRYTMSVTVRFANGTVGMTNVTLDAGPWVRVSLGAPLVTGREARLAVTNEGGLIVRRLVVEAEGNVTLSLLANGTTIAPRVSASGRLVFDVSAMAPGDVATLVARLPDGPLPSGARDVSLRVLALPGGA